MSINLFKNSFIATPFLRLSMNSVNKSFTFLLIVLLAISIVIMTKLAFAQTPAPSVPEFTVQLVGPPVTVPTTYSLNSTSGQIVANLGYTNEYSNIEITIKNQPAPSVVDGNAVGIYLDVRFEPHFAGDDWVDQYSFNNFTYADVGNWYADVSAGYRQLSNSTYTVIYLDASSYQPGSEIDVQVQASLGYYSTYSVYDYQIYQTISVKSFFAQQSGWSPTQTITIPANIPLSPTPAPTPSSSTPTSSLLLITLVVIAFLLAIIVFLLFYMRKRKTNNSNQQTVSNSEI